MCGNYLHQKGKPVFGLLHILRDSLLNIVDPVRLLGVPTDQEFQCKEHIDEVCKKAIKIDGDSCLGISRIHSTEIHIFTSITTLSGPNLSTSPLFEIRTQQAK